jgi:hypothetical protein
MMTSLTKLTIGQLKRGMTRFNKQLSYHMDADREKRKASTRATGLRLTALWTGNERQIA